MLSHTKQYTESEPLSRSPSESCPNLTMLRQGDVQYACPQLSTTCERLSEVVSVGCGFSSVFSSSCGCRGCRGCCISGVRGKRFKSGGGSFSCDGVSLSEAVCASSSSIATCSQLTNKWLQSIQRTAPAPSGKERQVVGSFSERLLVMLTHALSWRWCSDIRKAV